MGIQWILFPVFLLASGGEVQSEKEGEPPAAEQAETNDCRDDYEVITCQALDPALAASVIYPTDISVSDFSIDQTGMKYEYHLHVNGKGLDKHFKSGWWCRESYKMGSENSADVIGKTADSIDLIIKVSNRPDRKRYQGTIYFAMQQSAAGKNPDNSQVENGAVFFKVPIKLPDIEPKVAEPK